MQSYLSLNHSSIFSFLKISLIALIKPRVNGTIYCISLNPMFMQCENTVEVAEDDIMELFAQEREDMNIELCSKRYGNDWLFAKAWRGLCRLLCPSICASGHLFCSPKNWYELIKKKHIAPKS